MKKFYSHGKLLITGEYAVLDGAKALAVPTRLGQEMQVEENNEAGISWTSIDEQGKAWFKGEFLLKDDSFILKEDKANEPIASRLLEILNAANKLNPGFLSKEKAFKITTKLEFNRDWGLGSSSTLINNLATWLNINPYQLLKKTFGGSGYDIAAAMQNSAFTFQLKQDQAWVLKSQFEPEFKDQLFFVYLNQKQNSREAIAHYRNQPKEELGILVNKISGLTERFLECESLEEFRILMDLHETLISKAINLPKIKTRLFPDFSGSIKSLGAWGGDFVLATGGKEAQKYFKKEGYHKVFAYHEFIL